MVDLLLYWAFYSFVLLYATWIFFTAIMRLREVRDAGNLTFTKRPCNYLLAMPTLFIGFLLDVLANVFIFSIIGLEWPKFYTKKGILSLFAKSEWLSTWRMNRWFASKELSGLPLWRRMVANFFGVQILNDIDPSGKHIK